MRCICAAIDLRESSKYGFLLLEACLPTGFEGSHVIPDIELSEGTIKGGDRV